MKPLSQFLHIEIFIQKKGKRKEKLSKTSSLNLFLQIRIKHPYFFHMTNSQHSKSMHLSCNIFSLILLLVYFLFVGSCSSTRIGITSMKMEMNENTEHIRRKHNPDLVFNFLPKGMRIPPSGPSMRHNSEVDSTPHN